MTAQQHTTIDDLRVKLIAMLGRMVTVEEIRAGMSLKTSTYYDQLNEGRLICMDNIVTLARGIGVNEVALLVEMDLVDAKAALSYADWSGARTLREAKRSRAMARDL